jgi:hypothetical protein
MTHEQIVRRMKSMRTAELDHHRSNLELFLRTNTDPVELDRARYELNLAQCELDERTVKESMMNLFRINTRT